MKNLKTNFRLARTATTLLAIICSALSWADNVSEEHAMQLAQSFVNHHKTTAASPRRAPGTTHEVTPAGQISGLYVFNVVNDGGFVIVSNDDRTTPILGFSDSGSLDTENIPSNMRAWLQGYADEIAWVKTQSGMSTQSVLLNTPRRSNGHNAVAPLLSTQWNQSAPYYNQTPYYKKNADGSIEYRKDYKSDYSHCATGCVATAMAQVMNYHKWPTAQVAGVPGYTWGKAGIDLDALGSVTFDWNNMLNSYKSSYNTAQANAVSTLMKYCGWSVEMDYGPESGSNSENVAYALKRYFSYNTTTTQVISRTFYTYDNWVEIIYHEVNNSRPVVYSGHSSGGGHEFVCDGYKYTNGTDFFHINWGWGGLSDNYFVLSALDPDQQGIGGSSSTDGYRSNQDAVIGIQKNDANGTVSDKVAETKTIDLVLNSMTLDYSTIYLGMSVNVTLNITNNTNDEYNGGVSIGRVKNGSGENLASANYIIPAGGTIETVLSFTPYEVGAYGLLFFVPSLSGGAISDGVVHATLTVEPPLGSPTDLTVSDIRNNSAVLSWTDNNSASSWVVAYSAIGVTDFAEVTASTNPFTLTGLSPETDYAVKVRPANAADFWSKEVTFTTDVAYPAPGELAIGKITHNAAVVSWTGYADSYEVRHGIAPENFISTTATWLQYDNGTRTSCLGFGQEKYTWGVMYPQKMVTGNLLTKVSIFESYGNNSEEITVNIYSGGDNAPGTLLHTQVVATEALNAFHEVEFDKPVEITPGENLWITLTESGTHPLSYCEINDGTNSPNSQWVEFNGKWHQAQNLFNSRPENLCWMIRGYMESKGLNPDLVTWTTQTCDDHSCQLTGLDDAEKYVVQVRGKYNGEGSKWETIMFTTLENVILNDDATNIASTLGQHADDEEVSVTLSGRTLYKDGAWNTICLPFNLTLQGSPLEGAIAKTLTDATMTGTHVSLNFGEAVDELEAGIPYIIKWDNTEGTEENIVNPVFPSVTIASTEGQTITMANGDVKFIGYYDAFNINETNTDIYYMTVDNTLKHTAKARTLLACRAYFQFSEAATARKITLDFGDMTTEISNTEITEITEKVGDWYTLDGVKHGEQPTHKGIYIKDGKKVVIR
ncbi:MAG: C10 family peptidase [Prevotella sp.]|nr:C10 family peptidase [Prevotella sp.]